MAAAENPADLLRRRYTDEALRYLPRLFQMVDKNRYSPTYGSFDRSYWHYRTMDFPCGMYQEFTLPLALALIVALALVGAALAGFVGGPADARG